MGLKEGAREEDVDLQPGCLRVLGGAKGGDEEGIVSVIERGWVWSGSEQGGAR